MPLSTRFECLAATGASRERECCNHFTVQGAATVSGRRIKATHSWQDTELPNTDPEECEGIHEGHAHTQTPTQSGAETRRASEGAVCLYTLLLV